MLIKSFRIKVARMLPFASCQLTFSWENSLERRLCVKQKLFVNRLQLFLPRVEREREERERGGERKVCCRFIVITISVISGWVTWPQNSSNLINWLALRITPFLFSSLSLAVPCCDYLLISLGRRSRLSFVCLLFSITKFCYVYEPKMYRISITLMRQMAAGQSQPQPLFLPQQRGTPSPCAVL